MIGKNEQADKNSRSDKIKLITEKRQFLEDTSVQVQEEIKWCFKRLVDVLKSRERQLLRQVEAIHRQQLSVVQSNLELHASIPSLIVNLSKEQDIEKEILQFGKVELSNNNCIINDAEPYKAEDYQEANSDHVSFDKELQTEKIDMPSSLDPTNQSIELKTEIVPSRSWDLNSTELLNIQLIDEDLDKCCMINSEISLIETFNCSLCSKDTENSMKEINSVMREKNLTIEKNEGNANEKKEFCRNHNVSADDSEHPKQVQQWLQQILIETETEPNVPEIEQFSEIPKSRVYANFPLET